MRTLIFFIAFASVAFAKNLPQWPQRNDVSAGGSPADEQKVFSFPSFPSGIDGEKSSRKEAVEKKMKEARERMKEQQEKTRGDQEERRKEVERIMGEHRKSMEEQNKSRREQMEASRQRLQERLAEARKNKLPSVANKNEN